MKRIALFVVLILSAVIAFSPAYALDEIRKSKGSLVYVSTMRMIGNFHEPDELGELVEKFFEFNSRLAISNLDPNEYITLYSVKYKRTNVDGIVEEFDLIDTPVVISPFGSISYNPSMVGIPPEIRDPQNNENYGMPFFLVEWRATKSVIEPKIGAGVVVMEHIYGGVGTRLYGFTMNHGIVLEKY